jgi:uncharacterized paraquat-inducible protein A
VGAVGFLLPLPPPCHPRCRGCCLRRCCMARTASQTARAGVALSIRWQEMLNVYLSTLINNIVPLGFSADQHGLMAYNHHFTGLMASNSPLTEDLKALHKNVRAAWQTDRQTDRERLACCCRCQACSPRVLLLRGSRGCCVRSPTDLADVAAQVV